MRSLPDVLANSRETQRLQPLHCRHWRSQYFAFATGIQATTQLKGKHCSAPLHPMVGTGDPLYLAKPVAMDEPWQRGDSMKHRYTQLQFTTHRLTNGLGQTEYNQG